MSADDALLAKILQRDARAFEELMVRHRPHVLSRIWRIVRDEAAAEDLAQEVFLRVWTRADQWNRHGPLKAWLLRIGTNLALNHLRSVRRRRSQPLRASLPADEEQEAQPAWMVDLASLSPEALLELAEQRVRLRHLVDDLPEEKREIVNLVFEADMQLAEAARQLGIPTGTAKSRLHYAIRKLAQEWKDLQQDEEES